MKATTVVGVMVVQLLLFVSLSCLPMIQANTATAPSATAADMMPSMPYNGQEPLHALEEGRSKCWRPCTEPQPHTTHKFGAIVDPAPRPCLTLPSGLTPQSGTRRCLEKPKLTSASSKPLGQL